MKCIVLPSGVITSPNGVTMAHSWAIPEERRHTVDMTKSTKQQNVANQTERETVQTVGVEHKITIRFQSEQWNEKKH